MTVNVSVVPDGNSSFLKSTVVTPPLGACAARRRQTLQKAKTRHAHVAHRPFPLLLKGVGHLEAEDVERRPIPRAVADGMKDHEIEIADKGVVERNGMEGEPDLRAGGVEHVRTADAGLVGEEQLLAGVWRYLEVGYAPARADAKALPIAHVWLDEPLVAVLETRAKVKAERPEFRRGETQFEGGTLLGVKFIVNAFAYDPVPERQHEVLNHS